MCSRISGGRTENKGLEVCGFIGLSLIHSDRGYGESGSCVKGSSVGFLMMGSHISVLTLSIAPTTGTKKTASERPMNPAAITADVQHIATMSSLVKAKAAEAVRPYFRHLSRSMIKSDHCCNVCLHIVMLV